MSFTPETIVCRFRATACFETSQASSGRMSSCRSESGSSSQERRRTSVIGLFLWPARLKGSPNCRRPQLQSPCEPSCQKTNKKSCQCSVSTKTHERRLRASCDACATCYQPIRFKRWGSLEEALLCQILSHMLG